MSATLADSLTGEEARLAFDRNHSENQKHANFYWFSLGAAIFGLFLIKLLVVSEMAWWDLKNNKVRQVDLGYNMGSAAEDQHLVRATIPIWRRLMRAWMAFINKYFVGVQVPWINLNLAELGIVVDYIAFLLWILFTNTPDIPANPMMPNLVHGFSNRAGLLTFASLPFNVMLSSKVNLVAYLTGVSYERLQYLHRWVGRTTLALAIIHSSSKLSQSAHITSIAFQNYGLAAFCVACFVLITSHRWSLQYCYELFTLLHNFLVLSLLVLAWVHQPAHKQYLIVTIIIWGLDRLIRYARIFLYNGLWRFNCCKASSTAALRLLSHDTTRLEIYKADFPYWSPGAYAFISTPTLTWIPQSHPFTIASRPTKHRVTSLNTFDASLSTSALQSSTKDNDMMVPFPNLIFLIRARSGWTKKLHQLAQKETYPKIPIIIDGPYGGCPPLHIGFDSVILFAGGAGLSWTLPLLTDLVERSRRGQSAVRRITWICVLRHYVNYEWFFNELESVEHLATSSLLDLRIHYTTNAEQIDLVPQHFHPGRPDIQAIIENAVHESLGRIFVGVAGPLGPSEEVRRQCRRVISPMAILRGDPRGDIHFHSELFGW